MTDLTNPSKIGEKRCDQKNAEQACASLEFLLQAVISSFEFAGPTC